MSFFKGGLSNMATAVGLFQKQGKATPRNFFLSLLKVSGGTSPPFSLVNFQIPIPQCTLR